jgi:hypothetical protein
MVFLGSLVRRRGGLAASFELAEALFGPFDGLFRLKLVHPFAGQFGFEIGEADSEIYDVEVHGLSWYGCIVAMHRKM